MSADDGTFETVLAALARRLAIAARLAPVSSAPLLGIITRTAVTQLGARAASIALHDRPSDRLVFVAASGPAAGDVVGLSIDAAAGIAGYTFTTGQPIAVSDVAADPRFDRRVADATGYAPTSLLATPLADDRGVVGVFEVLDRIDGPFGLDDLEAAATLAADATSIVRAGQVGRDAQGLLRDALTAAAVAGDTRSELDDAAIEAIVGRATAGLAGSTDDDPTWALVERIAQLRDVDPASLELAADWLDVLIRRRTTRGTGRLDHGR
jgi:signal transduction protein with GAF and PtsI domain